MRNFPRKIKVPRKPSHPPPVKFFFGACVFRLISYCSWAKWGWGWDWVRVGAAMAVACQGRAAMRSKRGGGGLVGRGGGQTKMSWQSLLTAWCSRLRLRIKGAVKFFHFGLLCMVVLGMHTSKFCRW